jgi:hypothetical protein
LGIKQFIIVSLSLCLGLWIWNELNFEKEQTDFHDIKGVDRKESSALAKENMGVRNKTNVLALNESVKANDSFVTKSTKQLNTHEEKFSSIGEIISLNAFNTELPWTDFQKSKLRSLHLQLIKSPDPKVLEALLTWSQDLPEDHDARLQLIKIFGDVGYEKSKSWLRQSLEKSEPMLSSEAMLSLAQMKEHGMEDQAIIWSESEHADLRENALQTLALIGGEKSLSHLDRLMPSAQINRDEVMVIKDRITRRMASPIQ